MASYRRRQRRTSRGSFLGTTRGYLYQKYVSQPIKRRVRRLHPFYTYRTRKYYDQRDIEFRQFYARHKADPYFTSESRVKRQYYKNKELWSSAVRLFKKPSPRTYRGLLHHEARGMQKLKCKKAKDARRHQVFRALAQGKSISTTQRRIHRC